MTTTMPASNNTGTNLTLTHQYAYTLRNYYRYLGLAIAVVIFGVAFLALAAKQGFPSLRLLIVIVALAIFVGVIITLISHFAFRNVRLITSDEGIVFYGQGGYRLFTPWDNLMGRSVWYTGRGSIAAIRLRTSANEMSLAEGIQQRQAAIEKRGWINKMDTMHQAENRIPVGFFLSDWQRSPLASDIKQHVPDVDWNKRIVAG